MEDSLYMLLGFKPRKRNMRLCPSSLEERQDTKVGMGIGKGVSNQELQQAWRTERKIGQVSVKEATMRAPNAVNEVRSGACKPLSGIYKLG